jgi:flagellin
MAYFTHQEDCPDRVRKTRLREYWKNSRRLRQGGTGDMANIDLTRIRSNIQGLSILHNLRDVNSQLATHQLRVGTGKRINNAGDDPAGLTISTKLHSRSRVLSQLYDNIGQAKNMLAVAEGALMKINDILVTMNEKNMMAATDSLGTAERLAVTQQLVQMVEEVNEIATQTEFNGVNLLSGSSTFKFQTSAENQTVWQTQDYSTLSLDMINYSALTNEDVIDSANYKTYFDEIDAAMDKVSEGLTNLGSLSNRLTAKERMTSVMQTNTEAAYNRIFNADMAHEQIEVTKNQILQQTSFMMLAQANTNSQAVLSLFRQ